MHLRHEEVRKPDNALKRELMTIAHTPLTMSRISGSSQVNVENLHGNHPEPTKSVVASRKAARL